jgi:glutathione S-transferase
MAATVLYDHPESSNALKVRFLVAEMGVTVERRTIPIARPRPARYLALNPLGGIPTLVDGDLVVGESNAILRYLVAREGRDDLYPSSARERAVVDEWIDRFSTRLRAALFRHEAPALGYTRNDGFVPGRRDPLAAEQAAEAIAGELALLNALVGAEAAVLGRFTIADCVIAPVLYRTFHTGLDLGPYPNLAALRATLTARPAWARADAVL